ncbi:DUF6443 domain-containing protein [uncultured Flavobacterium sp.]|uniref:DUF6443 domain-containing protein n=1 Tax=uncultured Flavobacterium sp. TaxID=165435 RepID=UPI0025DC9017|nr:DUF6443 domain-containing protein [uncultured Flavobacterium sp.]
MKKILFAALLAPMLATAQDPNQNYIKTTSYKLPTATAMTSPSPAQASQSITYFDGLGRPVQQVAGKQSSEGKDIVTHIEYDAFGRQAKEYLPYPSANTALEFTSPQTALQATLSHYQSAYGDANPFSEKLFEASPLNRVLKQAAPGNDWAIGNGHEVNMDYQTNAAADAVKLYIANAGAPSGGYYPVSLSQQSNYPAGMLYKTVTKDENWISGKANTTEEYKSKEGQVVLKRTYDMVPSRGGLLAKAHNTYYVYDQYGNLSFVLPPLSDGSGSQQDLAGLCYQYRYDYRNRLVEKKLPGKQWEFIIYDKLDRAIATGPSLHPFGNGTEGWLFTKYDIFNRVAYTGWYNGHQANSLERNNLQTLANSATILSESRVANSSIDNISIGYGNTAFPTASFYLLSASYYDNYDFPNAGTLPASIFGIPVLADVKGLPTGSWTRVLTSDTDRAGDQSVIFYDSKSRPIRNYLKNYLGGYTQTDSRVDFSGKTLYTVTEHRKEGTSTPITIREDFSYSDQDRLLTHTHQINGGLVELLSKNEYDGLGQLIKKSIGRTASSPLQQADYSYNIRGWLKEINKTDDLNPQGGIADLFAFKINYNNIGNTLHSQISPLYNGNIAETYWKTSSDSHLRGYGYAYDNLNRLKSSFYHKNGLSTGCYDESLSYDMNGNIQSLLRFGNSDGQNMALKIDELAYTYHPDKKNQLLKVFDSSNHFLGFDDDSPDGIADNDDDYDYDANGNMIKDQNKGITSISYNHLNLPVRIIFNNDLNTRIDYIYRADGSKIQKKAFSYNPPPGNFGTISAVTEYMGGFQYKQGVLQFFPTAEGYVNHTSGSYSYVYNYTDHLGNIRLSYAQDPQNPATLKIIEENHYYPFGLKHTNYNIDVLAFEKNSGNLQLKAPVGGPKALAYQYKYQGQERQDELGLNWDSFKWRNYDYAIGRFFNVDPLAEKYAYNSPYAIQENKMGMGRELEGLELAPWVGIAVSSSSPITSSPLLGASDAIKVGGETGGKTEIHHLIPRSLKNNETVKSAREEGFKFEGAENKMPVEKFSKATGKGRHGNHPDYNKAIDEKITTGKTEGVSSAELLRNIVSETKDLIKNNPDKKINDLFKTNTVIESTGTTKPELPKPKPAPEKVEFIVLDTQKT